MSENIVTSSEKFKDDAFKFVPICCHYDKNTLLTKNGELIQTFQINGLNQENISKKLLGLREIIRESFKKHFNDTNISCWVHTVRKKVNLDDTKEYNRVLSDIIHKKWVNKNYWHDKFVNTLYVTFVHSGQDLSIKDLSSFINSFKRLHTINSHTEYLEKAHSKLSNIVDGVISELGDFGCKKLGIYYEGEEAYCSMTSLFYGLVRGVNVPIKVVEKDLSEVIGAFSYAVGSDKIEVISDNKRKYATIISVKEYHEVKAKCVDDLLQQPTEFVITEVFYFEDPKKVKKKIENQDYIIKVSKDETLDKLNGIKQLNDSAEKYDLPYCNQQISILLMNEDYKYIEASTENASFSLSKIGIVHVREDINIENTFWSQLPGNFKYLRRLSPVSIENVASMASLHNFPAGSHVNPWGRAITILRTEIGTPFFFNFHITEHSSAKCLLIGNEKSGKTVLANFIVSEAMKFDPSLFFITYSSDSEVFIKGLGGLWKNKPFNLDPLRIKSIYENKTMLKEFLLGMANHNNKPLTENEIAIIDDMISYFENLDESNLSFAKINDYEFKGETGESVKIKMSDYLEGGIYHKYFIDDGEWEANENIVMSVNFEVFSNEQYNKENYPDTERELPQYYEKFNKFSIFREMLVYTNMFKYLDKFKNQKQIVKLENYNDLCSASFSSEFYNNYFTRLSDADTIYINSILYENEDKFFQTELWKNMQDQFETKIYLPAESINNNWQKELQISDKAYHKLKMIIPASRLFVIEQKDLTLACELSIASLTAALQILSADPKLIEKCNMLIAQKGVESEKWVEEFYDSLS